MKVNQKNTFNWTEIPYDNRQLLPDTPSWEKNNKNINIFVPNQLFSEKFDYFFFKVCQIKANFIFILKNTLEGLSFFKCFQSFPENTFQRVQHFTFLLPSQYSNLDDSIKVLLGHNPACPGK